MLDRMTEGGVVIIESLSRLGRSTKDLIELTELFRSRGVNLILHLERAIEVQRKNHARQSPKGSIKSEFFFHQTHEVPVNINFLSAVFTTLALFVDKQCY